MQHIQGLVFSYKHLSRISVATTTAIAIAITTLLHFFLCFQSPGLPLPQFSVVSSPTSPSPPLPPADPCSGRYVYIYDLPPRFNSDLLRECSTLNMWTDMCKLIVNSGFGPHLNDSSQVLSQDGSGWYTTDQYSLDIIFHNRMKQYPCRTTNSSIAEAMFVPFYAGLDFSWHKRGYNISVRDALSLDLAQWLRSRPEWQLYGGSDHFLVSGRITYDHKRSIEKNKFWGNKLMLLPEIQNFTLLAIESSPFIINEVAIPYPTYFHPSNESQVAAWQEEVRSAARPWLFSFAGAPRPNQAMSIRNHLINQCRQSDECRLLQCGNKKNSCHSPTRIIKLFKHSKFCLQPSGDSFTRRSTFDSILSGCIPVFFHPGSAYTQYMWFLPKNYTKYSVFIAEDEVREGKVSIEEVLSEYSEEQVRGMRENVIGLIPQIVYRDPRCEAGAGAGNGVRDAFDVAIEGVLERVKRLKEEGAAAVAAGVNQRFSDRIWGRFFGIN